jgi:Holliday junction DNA helicase RuvB
VIRAATTEERSGNELRPTTFMRSSDRRTRRRTCAGSWPSAKRKGKPLAHCLFVGPSGTGKTTLAHVCAHELGARVYQLEAPISADTLLELRTAMRDGDILFLDEIHQQAISERRGKSASTQPEVLFSVMEDRTIPTGMGVLPFPAITVMGATTDKGLLPEAFVNRFPIKPPFADYTRPSWSSWRWTAPRSWTAPRRHAAAHLRTREPGHPEGG